MSDRDSKVQGYVMSDVTKINFTFHLPGANNLRTTSNQWIRFNLSLPLFQKVLNLYQF